MTSRRVLPVLAFLLCAPFAFVACSGEGADARKAGDALAADLQSGKALTVPFAGGTRAASDAYLALVEPLRGFETAVDVDQVTRSGDEADVRLAWTQTRDGVTWKRTTQVTLTKKDGAWEAEWDPALVADGLDAGDTLQVASLRPERGRILGSGDRPLVQPRPVVRFGIDKLGLKPVEVPTAVRRLAALLDLRPGPLLKAATAAGPKAFVQAVVLRRADAEKYLGGIAGIYGARAISDDLPLAPTKDFAAALLGTVGPATAEIIKDSDGRLVAGDDTGLSGLQKRYDEQLFGTRGLRVTAIADTKADPSAENEVLFEQSPVAGEDLRTTLDLRLQNTAQRLLGGIGPASALVAIKPSTGEILAAASGPGSEGYNTATFGQYAPGSTFKSVSALALLRAGVKPTSTVPCTPTVSVNGKQFKNYDDYPSGRLGRIPLRVAIANSCNTAFISQRDELSGTDLADAAAALGLGVDHDLGFPAYFGQVPAPGSETEAAADLIGQGKVLASPMAMATVMASIVKGATVLPSLLPAYDVPAGDAPAKPLTAAEANALRGLLHAVVTEGSGAFLRVLEPPQVLAKTGTAEYGTPKNGALPTHAWMIGAQGDLAIAVFVDTGQSGSRTAGPILEGFLRAAR